MQVQEKIEIREPIIIENNDLHLFGMLHRPVCAMAPPLVLVFHGFASSKQGSNRSYVYLAETLSRFGIATLRFDFRGSGDSEGSLSDMTFEDFISDAQSLFNRARSIQGIDFERVGIFGSSLGGSIAVLSQKFMPEIRTMVLWAPVASGRLWFLDYLKQNPELLNKQPEKALESFRGIKLHPLFREQFGKMNAASELKSFQNPILHMQGDKDTTVGLAHQEAYRASAWPASRFITYPDVEHQLGYQSIFQDVLRETVNWFNEHL